MDINAEVRDTLLKTGNTVVFQYPKSFYNLPVISFFLVKEYGSESYDNTEAFRDATVAVDIWAKTPDECVEISQHTVTVMADDGWSELFRMDVPRGNSDVYHRTVRFVKSFSVNS